MLFRSSSASAPSAGLNAPSPGISEGSSFTKAAPAEPSRSASAMGAAKGVAAALIIAVVVASVFGILNILRFYHVVRSRQRRRRLANRGVAEAIRTARVVGRYLPFGPYLALGIGIVLLDWKDVLTLLPFGP